MSEEYMMALEEEYNHPEESCRLCRFYRQDSPGYGVCRRRAPVVILTHTPPITMFPDVADGVWCGEFEDTGGGETTIP